MTSSNADFNFPAFPMHANPVPSVAHSTASGAPEPHSMDLQQHTALPSSGSSGASPVAFISPWQTQRTVGSGGSRPYIYSNEHGSFRRGGSTSSSVSVPWPISTSSPGTLTTPPSSPLVPSMVPPVPPPATHQLQRPLPFSVYPPAPIHPGINGPCGWQPWNMMQQQHQQQHQPYLNAMGEYPFFSDYFCGSFSGDPMYVPPPPAAAHRNINSNNNWYGRRGRGGGSTVSSESTTSTATMSGLSRRKWPAEGSDARRYHGSGGAFYPPIHSTASAVHGTRDKDSFPSPMILSEGINGIEGDASVPEVPQQRDSGGSGSNSNDGAADVVPLMNGQLNPFNIAAYAESHCLLCGEYGHEYTVCDAYDGAILCFYNQADTGVYVMRHESWLSDATMENVAQFIERVLHVSRHACELWVGGHRVRAKQKNKKWCRDFANTGNREQDEEDVWCTPAMLRTQCCKARVVPGVVVYVAPIHQWSSSAGTADSQHPTPLGMFPPNLSRPVFNAPSSGHQSDLSIILRNASINRSSHSDSADALRHALRGSQSLLVEEQEAATCPTAPTCNEDEATPGQPPEEGSTDRVKSGDIAARAKADAETATVTTTLTTAALQATEESGDKDEKEREARHTRGTVATSNNEAREGVSASESPDHVVSTSTHSSEVPCEVNSPIIVPLLESAGTDSALIPSSSSKTTPDAPAALGSVKHQKRQQHREKQQPQQQQQPQRKQAQQQQQPTQGNEEEDVNKKYTAILERLHPLSEEVKGQLTFLKVLERSGPRYWSTPERLGRTLHIKFVPSTFPFFFLRVLLMMYGELHKVRVVRPRPVVPSRRLFFVCFVEYASKAEARLAASFLNGLALSENYFLAVDAAVQPITGGYMTDYDEQTGKPCTFGIPPEDIRAVDRQFGFSREQVCAAKQRRELEKVSNGGGAGNLGAPKADMVKATGTVVGMCVGSGNKKNINNINNINNKGGSGNGTSRYCAKQHCRSDVGTHAATDDKRKPTGAIVGTNLAIPVKHTPNDKRLKLVRGMTASPLPPPIKWGTLEELAAFAELRHNVIEGCLRYVKNAIESNFCIVIEHIERVLHQTEYWCAARDGALRVSPMTDAIMPNPVILYLEMVTREVALFVHHDAVHDGKQASQIALKAIKLARAFACTMHDFDQSISGRRSVGMVNFEVADSPSWWGLFSFLPQCQHFDAEQLERALEHNVILPLGETETVAALHGPWRGQLHRCPGPYPRVEAVHCFIQRLLQIALLLDNYVAHYPFLVRHLRSVMSSDNAEVSSAMFDESYPEEQEEEEEGRQECVRRRRREGGGRRSSNSTNLNESGNSSDGPSIMQSLSELSWLNQDDDLVCVFGAITTLIRLARAVHYYSLLLRLSRSLGTPMHESRWQAELNRQTGVSSAAISYWKKLDMMMAKLPTLSMLRIGKNAGTLLHYLEPGVTQYSTALLSTRLNRSLIG